MLEIHLKIIQIQFECQRTGILTKTAMISYNHFHIIHQQEVMIFISKMKSIMDVKS